MQHLRIFEMNYSCSPGGVDEWEVQDEDGNILQSFFNLKEAVDFAYNRGGNFTIFTLAAWEEEYGALDVPTAITKEWSLV